MSEITITPLGTISPYTKGNMNCPGVLINYNNKKILLDCGSGITRLLKFPDTLEDLNVIITHYHRDHFGDIGSICYASYVYHNLGLLNNKINIFLPKNDYDFNKKSIVSSKESYAKYFDITDSYSFFIDDLKITFHDNKSHTIEAFMVKLQNKDFAENFDKGYEEFKNKELKNFNISEYLDSKEIKDEYLAQVLKDGDKDELAEALENIEKSKT